MDKDFIAGLMAIVQRSAIAELEFSEGNQRIRIIRQPAGASVVSPQADGEQHSDRPNRASTGRIIAGMTGLFYRSPSPGAKPFVSIGDEVEEGQTLALLEAMKMLTPVEAELAGHVATIDAEDCACIERGALLFTIKPRDG